MRTLSLGHTRRLILVLVVVLYTARAFIDYRSIRSRSCSRENHTCSYLFIPVVGSQCYGVTPALGDGACFFHALVPALSVGDCRDLKHALWAHIEELHRAKDPGIQLAVGLDGTLTEYSRRYQMPAFHGGSVEAFAFTSWAKCELRVYHPAVENVATTNERLTVTSSSHAREGSDVRFMVALVWNGGHYDTLYTSRVGEQRTATAREYRLPWGGG